MERKRISHFSGERKTSSAGLKEILSRVFSARSLSKRGDRFPVVRHHAESLEPPPNLSHDKANLIRAKVQEQQDIEQESLEFED